MNFKIDHLIFCPNDVNLDKSPLRKTLKAETFILGAFNPGFTRLPNGNLLLMVRVAEALKSPIIEDKIHSIRWDSVEGYVQDEYAINNADTTDPRSFRLTNFHAKTIALTSISWLLPVELNTNGTEVIAIHYSKAIEPSKSYQEYGIEDPRISKIDQVYYMTTCSVSAERHSTTLYKSINGLDYELLGIVLDHQNKDMLLFEGKINDKFFALTRPIGELYFAYSPQSIYNSGPSINMASSPDGLHWKPCDEPFLRAKKDSLSSMKVGGGSQPILTDDGWLILYHGVEQYETVGIYRTFWALMDKENPLTMLKIVDTKPLMEANPRLTASIAEQIYLTDVVFTTGIVAHENDFIIASGELDLACRITHISKDYFKL